MVRLLFPWHDRFITDTGSLLVLDYLAESVASFLSETQPPVSEEEKLHLGLTFSFPVEQSALDKGVLLTWTKGFSAKNAIGHDVVQLLQSAFDRKGVHVKCVALVNDVSCERRSCDFRRVAKPSLSPFDRLSVPYCHEHTLRVAVYSVCAHSFCHLITELMQRFLFDHAGAIFGTGTNGAYLEDVSNIAKLKGTSAAALGGKMIVNTEWGAFNNSVRSLNPYLSWFDVRRQKPEV